MSINIKRKLESLTFDTDEEWEKHLEKFHYLISKLAAYDRSVGKEDKVSKFLRTLSPRFAPIAMMAESSEAPFEKVVASVEAEISRREKQGLSKSLATPVVAAALKDRVLEKSGPGIFCKTPKDVCYFCRRMGHNANKYWFEQSSQDRLVREIFWGRRSRGFRGRGRGFKQYRNIQSRQNWTRNWGNDNPQNYRGIEDHPTPNSENATQFPALINKIWTLIIYLPKAALWPRLNLERLLP